MAIYLRLNHRADIHSKTTVTNAAGQKKPTWTASATSVKCIFVARYAMVRTSPTYEERETINFFFPNDTTINYDSRIYNVKDRLGNVLDAGPFEIIAIIKQPGFTGKLHHYFVTARRVIES